jgi:hypothetical protein
MGLAVNQHVACFPAISETFTIYMDFLEQLQRGNQVILLIVFILSASILKTKTKILKE